MREGVRFPEPVRYLRSAVYKYVKRSRHKMRYQVLTYFVSAMTSKVMKETCLPQHHASAMTSRTSLLRPARTNLLMYSALCTHPDPINLLNLHRRHR